MSDDDMHNNLVAAGALLAILQGANFGQIEAINVVPDNFGNPTNAIEVELSFMPSPYRLTVERVKS